MGWPGWDGQSPGIDEATPSKATGRGRMREYAGA